MKYTYVRIYSAKSGVRRRHVQVLLSIDTTFRDLCSFQCHVIAQKRENKFAVQPKCKLKRGRININPHTTLAQYNNTRFIGQIIAKLCLTKKIIETENQVNQPRIAEKLPSKLGEIKQHSYKEVGWLKRGGGGKETK